MNRYKEALLDIQYICEQSQKYKKLQKYNAKGQLKILQELVDKATPKAPSVEHSGQRSPDGTSVIRFFKYNCPRCESRVTVIDEFCPECGQAIDWGKR
nr:MAG TPA: hypothetical protein [Siphoviridae sp. ctWyD10]